MNDFRQLSDMVWASPQITPDTVMQAKQLGFSMIINNRPDGEAGDQPVGDAIAAEAARMGIAYLAIPIKPGGFSSEQVSQMRQALDSAEGPVLAYCRTGTRSTLLWALAQASRGVDLGHIASAAAQAGYDVSPIRPIMESLAASNEE